MEDKSTKITYGNYYKSELKEDHFSPQLLSKKIG